MRADFRQAKIEDLPTLKLLIDRLAADDLQYDRHVNVEFSGSPDVNNLLTNLINLDVGFVLIAEYRHEPIGFLLGELGNKKGLTISNANLRMIYVDSRYRGNKIGKKMMAQFEEWARSKGAGVINLMTYSANSRALRFYRRQGLGNYMIELSKDL